MLLTEIIEIIEKAFPKELAYDWDNVGLLAGSKNRDIKNILLTLDITEGVIDEAILTGADLILSHHPILFGGTKRVTDETDEGRILIKAVKNDIAIYAAHTNCDVAPEGINAYLAELFELENAESLEETGLGRLGTLNTECSLEELSKQVCRLLNTPHVRVCGDLNRKIKKMAIGSGACSDLIPTALSKGAEVMLTADMKYHEMLTAEASGICVIDAGHYPTEIAVLEIFEKLLSGLSVKLTKSTHGDVFRFI